MVYESFVAFSSRIYCFTSFVSSSQGFPKPLSKEEELECIKKAHAGDKAARDKIITHNLRLVAHVVKGYNNTLEADDLLSVGTIGLIKAVDTFEPDKGVQLSTYAARCIHNEILMLLRANKRHQGVISLNSPYLNDKNDSEIELQDILPASEDEDEVLDKVERNCLYDNAIEIIDKKLDPLERDVLLRRYGLEGKDEKLQREVAKELGISRSYVSRLETKALKTLKSEIDPEN